MAHIPRRFAYKQLFALGFALYPGLVYCQFSHITNPDFFSSTEWSGSFKRVELGSITEGPLKKTHNRTGIGTLKLTRFDSVLQAWVGTFTGTVTMDDKDEITLNGCVSTITRKGTEAAQGFGGAPVIAQLMSSRLTSDSFIILMPNIDGVMARVETTVVCGGAVTPVPGYNDRIGWAPHDDSLILPIPPTGLRLAGTTGFPLGLVDKIPITFTWDLQGLSHPLEVIIEPQGYDTWRPEAGADEKTPANDISVKATIRYVDGAALQANDKASRFEFQLTGVSREPGIALNYPAPGKALKDPDLQFDATRNGQLPIKISGTDHDQAESTGAPHDNATVVVSSYDWGGWGAIKVTAVTVDGRRVIGYLKEDKSQTSVRLPKRAQDSFIADAWKTKTGISKPDNDDSEKDPKGLQDCDGDGLTLYEEYRGFFENGAHIEGNPAKKDLFVRNEGGSTLEPGIWMFSDLTGLEVHKDLQNDEFDSNVRTMNANHGTAPHRVDQHGVLLKICPGIDGGATTLNKAGVHARPGLVDRICIQPPDSLGTLTRQFNLAASDAIFSYDIAVAHEMLHASGVDHHGDADLIHKFLLVLADDPTNRLGKPYYEVDGAIATVLDEATGEDVAEREAALVPRHRDDVATAVNWMIERGFIRADERASFDQTLQALASIGKDTLVGHAGGEHSGSDSCVMRYFFARYYPAVAQANLYYLVPNGTEPSGTGICEQAEGTGVNAPSRNPQSRYSDASNSRGGCRFWVCVNDAIPPGVY